MAKSPIDKILPAHGSHDRIAAGGYDSSFIDATVRYIAAVDEAADEPKAWTHPLSEAVAEDVSRGYLIYYAQ
jgi:cyclase